MLCFHVCFVMLQSNGHWYLIFKHMCCIYALRRGSQLICSGEPEMGQRQYKYRAKWTS